jgi:hypothetical protein
LHLLRVSYRGEITKRTMTEERRERREEREAHLKSRTVGKPLMTTPGNVKSFFVPSIFPTNNPRLEDGKPETKLCCVRGGLSECLRIYFPSDRIVGSSDLQCPHLRRSKRGGAVEGRESRDASERREKRAQRG